jgi:hypothetical protein
LSHALAGLLEQLNLVLLIEHAEILVCWGAAVANELPAKCRRDSFKRRNMAEQRTPRAAFRLLECAALFRSSTHGPSPPPDDCKTSIIGSTPITASNVSPAHGHFPVVALPPCPSESAGLPTFSRRDSAA